MKAKRGTSTRPWKLRSFGMELNPEDFITYGKTKKEAIDNFFSEYYADGHHRWLFADVQEGQTYEPDSDSDKFIICNVRDIIVAAYSISYLYE